MSPTDSLKLIHPYSGILKIIYSKIGVQGRVTRGFAKLVMFGSPLTLRELYVFLRGVFLKMVFESIWKTGKGDNLMRTDLKMSFVLIINARL